MVGRRSFSETAVMTRAGVHRHHRHGIEGGVLFMKSCEIVPLAIADRFKRPCHLSDSWGGQTVTLAR
jgi:hypothetical protein